MSDNETTRSPSPTPAQNAHVDASQPSEWQLDVKRLHSLPSEQQDLYLFTFTAGLARHVESLDSDGAAKEQAAVNRELFQILNLTSPVPSRIIRRNLGRCFAGIFGKENRRLLYESINELVAIVNPLKEHDLKTRHAAVYCLGALFEAAGDSAFSLSSLAGTSLLKLLKPAANDAGLRGAIFRALGKIIGGIVSAIDEDLARSIWKQARSAVNGDRSLLVQANALWCFEQLARHSTYFDNSNDFEKLQPVIWKAMDGPSVAVRKAAASCLATILVKSHSTSQVNEAVPRLRKPKKVKKGGKPEEENEEIDRTASPAPEKPSTTLAYDIQEILKLLSVNYIRSSASNRLRAGVMICYVKVLKQLGPAVLESKYSDIARHLLFDLLAHPNLQSNVYRLLITRKFVGILLESVIERLLGEMAQLNSCRYLLNEVIKDYPPSLKERTEPSKQTLTGALSAITSLIKSLDAAIGPIAETARDALLQVLQHPSFTVQIHCARALRALNLACPQQLLPSISFCIDNVQRELGQLSTPNKSPRRCVGYAYGLAAILSISSKHPLYVSVNIYAQAFSQATDLLKSASGSDLHVSACQLQVAWIIIGSLMSLGPNFVKIHLSQLMLMWKNALPRPLSKENVVQRSILELSYLTHVRECALASMKAFLTFNQRLLTFDVSRRLSALLENTVAFLHNIPEKRTSDDPGSRLSPAFQLQDYELMVRRRVFQCFSQLLTLAPVGAVETNAYSSILPLAVSSFSSVEHHASNSLSASIASAAGSFESIWDVGDNFGFGINGLVCSMIVRNPVTGKGERHWSTRSNEESEIDHIIHSPICSTVENDPTCCYLPSVGLTDDLSDPSATELVNAAISAFSLSLPLQGPKVQESLLVQITACLQSHLLQKDPARKAAITINAALAIKTALEVTTGEVGISKGSFQHVAVEKSLQSLVHSFICDPDQAVRLMGACSLGRLCGIAGSTFTATEVSWLTGTIVNNREPYVRAGCALALANIHSQLGGMAAGLHMKNIVGILMSLAADTHPLVHFWAFDSFAQVAESAGLNFAGYVTTSIGMLSQLYISDSHNVETSSLASSNMLEDLPVTASIARVVDSLINVLGPDLQDLPKPRSMVLNLVQLLSRESSLDVQLISLRCMEHLSLYAPSFIQITPYIQRLQAGLNSEYPEMRTAAVTGLFNLMRRDAPDIVSKANPGLEDRLWDLLNEEPQTEIIRDIFTNWLQQTGPTNPEDWISRCNAVLIKTKAKDEQPKTAIAKESASEIQDEEIAGFATAAGTSKDEDTPAANSTQELMRWQVRLFAMECLHTLIAMISKEATYKDDSQGEAALQHKVADVVRIGFSASTAGVAALRVVGLRIVEQILKMFGKTPDPDFSEAMLLEQYQAQISSALTPAFAADSSPELAAEAVNVCATFISTGIVTDVERMGRILKLLVSALDSLSKDTETSAIGDLQPLGSNAQIMVRMSIYSAWAELQVASAEQKYLSEVVKPHIAQLIPLWLSSLREYARLRFEPDISATTSSLSASTDLDTVYAALNRQTLLKFYHDSWLSLVDAIASLIEEDSELVFDALDSKHVQQEFATSDTNGLNGAARRSAGIDYREEPVAFFFVLFGLAFESLAVRAGEDDGVTRERNLDILRALKKILRPSVSGSAIYQEIVFTETMDLLDRMVLTESLGVQSIIVEIAHNLCLSHPSSRQASETPMNVENLSEDIEQLFELTRIIVLVLAGLIPGLSDSPVSVRLESSDEASALVRTALQALVDVSDVFPTIIRTDLHAAILHIFVTILGTGACQAVIVPQALPMLRRFITSMTAHPQPHTEHQLLNALARMLMILRNAQRRESDSSLSCEKHTLLACAILVSSASDYLNMDKSLVGEYVVELTESLEAPSTARTAAGCIRTLLIANIAPKQLITHTVEFVLNASDVSATEDSRALMVQTLILYTTRVPADQKLGMTALCVRVLLGRAAKDGADVYADTASKLLGLGNADHACFRAVVASLAAEEKSLFEKVLKHQTGSRSRRSYDDDHEPTIALKLDFGS